jgi:hypothetical protein
VCALKRKSSLNIFERNFLKMEKHLRGFFGELLLGTASCF